MKRGWPQSKTDGAQGILVVLQNSEPQTLHAEDGKCWVENIIVT